MTIKEYRPKGLKALLLRFLARNPEATRKEMAQELEITESHLDMLLSQLRNKGLLKKHVFYEVDYIGLRWDNGAVVRRAVPPGIKVGTLGWWRHQFNQWIDLSKLTEWTELSPIRGYLNSKICEVRQLHLVETWPLIEIAFTPEDEIVISVVGLK